MEKDITQIITSFRNSSSRIFQLLYNDFKANASQLNRRKDENVFQQLQSRYSEELKKQLVRLAEKAIGNSINHTSTDNLQKELAGQISYYLSEFMSKTEAMS